MKTELGKYFLDVSKLVLGGAVLSTILEIKSVEKLIVVIIGFVSSIVFLLIGLYILRNKKR